MAIILAIVSFNIMIPQKIFFIWIGQLPAYVKFAINAYRNLNPSFNIQLIHYTINQFETLYFQKHIRTEIDRICYILIDDILNYRRYALLIDKWAEMLYNYNDVPFIQAFCDILRIELLNIYGGLYIDCDTFPIRPFDDELLNVHDRVLIYHDINGELRPDSYFIGSSGKTFWENYFDGTAYKIIQKNSLRMSPGRKQQKPLDYFVRRIKFFRCQLNMSDMKVLKTTTDYFEHYSEFRWGNGNIPKTKFDAIFDVQNLIKRIYENSIHDNRRKSHSKGSYS